MTKPLGTQSFEADAAALRSTLPGEWVLLDETTLTGSVVSVTFASIPGNYRTLMLVALGRTDRAMEQDEIYWRANADAGANYDLVYFVATGNNGQASAGTRAAGRGLAGVCEAANSRASNFSPTICYWPGYASTTIEKYSTTGNSVRLGDVSADADMELFICAARWRSTAAITSLTLLPGTGPNFVSGCVFSLYGIL